MTHRAVPAKAPTSFGARAHDYDRLRPGYPRRALTEAWAALGGGPPGTALDVGCGTGKLAGALAALGHEVTGVEPDPRMAAVAAANGLAVEVATFEEWDPCDRRFDLVACGQAWHWLRAGNRTAKAARCLHPAGRVLLAWNFGSHTPSIGAGLTRVYAAALPHGLPTGEGGRKDLSEADADEYAEELRSHGFAVTKTAVPWQSHLTSREFCTLLGTESRHLALPWAIRRRLLRAVARHLDAEEGGGIRMDYTCVIVGASRAG
ncbi:class I SAM-dependent methyltransferase [Streptomyces sp. NRRL F-525]|uniref:class I SAM-dependent methyltransferase n=1 Tax=Streptomyces sp. NRRL F-525 TaxID=1463861 RepID=UPI000689E4F1|nr:class I SAM-dependent methyltransferase [Streptomyces sp. NRRL F-525]